MRFASINILVWTAVWMLGACQWPKTATRSAVPIAELSGTWRLKTDRKDERDLIIIRDGNTFVGSVSDGPVSGIIKGNTFTILMEKDAVHGEGKVDGDQILGTYFVPDENHHGTWKASRVLGKAIIQSQPHQLYRRK
ncbi:MAG: hypothetical protein J0L75_08050 [Spirochaetes bacterium]|nr:hypothetical protein [Spirochaetota bacterium]